MMRLTIVAVAAALLVSPFAGAFGLDNVLEEAADIAPGTNQWIVGFHEMPDIKEGDLYLGERVVSVTPELAFLTVSTLSPVAFQARAMLDENVRYTETDLSDHSLHYSPNDYFNTHAANWAAAKIGLYTAWDTTLGATSIKDGHIDSGIYRAHEDFTPASRYLTGWDYYYNDNNPEDTSKCSWHGSHTTGTVSATINNGKGFPGTAQITVIPIKIFHGSGGGPYACKSASTTNLANAIKYAGDQGAHISSNSWGGGSFSSAINDAITYSVGKGVIFVAAAGNGGCNNCVGNPWAPQEANVIIVTATDSSDNGASFNSKGWQTDVSAPGVYIGSAGGPNANSYYVMDGTSMATPYVAGVAGLIKTLHPTWTRAQVEDRLKSTAVDLGAPGEDDTFGAGRINAAAAVY